MVSMLSAGTVTLTNTFTSGTIADPSQVNTNFTDITTEVNGNIENVNVSGTAAIVASKLNLSSIAEDVTITTTDNTPLTLNNSSAVGPIFTALDNGTTAFTILDGGLSLFGDASKDVSTALSFEDMGVYEDSQAAIVTSSIDDTSLLSMIRSSGTHASKTAIQTDSDVGTISFRGFVGSEYVTIADISSTSSGTITDASNGSGGYLAFKTRLAGANLLERVRIDEVGNVGIGTTSPDEELDINGNIQAEGNLIQFGSASDNVTLALKFETLGTYRDGQAGIAASSIADSALLMGLTARGTHASKTAITPGDIPLNIAGAGFVGGSGNYVSVADIIFTASGTVTDATNGSGGYITFRTRSSGAGLVEKLRLSDDGLHHFNATSTKSDVTIEVSSGGVTGGGSIHRAASGTHSSRNRKSDIRNMSAQEKQQRFIDVKNLKHVEFRYKKLNKQGKLVPDPNGKLRKGLILEDAPASIKDGAAIMIDDRILNLEITVQLLIQENNDLKARVDALEAFHP